MEDDLLKELFSPLPSLENEKSKNSNEDASASQTSVQTNSIEHNKSTLLNTMKELNNKKCIQVHEAQSTSPEIKPLKNIQPPKLQGDPNIEKDLSKKCCVTQTNNVDQNAKNDPIENISNDVNVEIYDVVDTMTEDGPTILPEINNQNKMKRHERKHNKKRRRSSKHDKRKSKRRNINETLEKLQNISPMDPISNLLSNIDQQTKELSTQEEKQKDAIQKKIYKKIEKRNKKKKYTKKVPVCMFYLEGRCAKGIECPFRHEGELIKKSEICRYYLVNACAKGDKCVFSHDLKTLPCRYFHLNGRCRDGDECRFSHDPITEEQRVKLKEEVEERERETLKKMGLLQEPPPPPPPNPFANNLFPQTIPTQDEQKEEQILKAEQTLKKEEIPQSNETSIHERQTSSVTESVVKNEPLFKTVKIKQEPIDDTWNTTQTNGITPLFTNITIKQEPVNDSFGTSQPNEKPKEEKLFSFGSVFK